MAGCPCVVRLAAEPTSRDAPAAKRAGWGTCPAKPNHKHQWRWPLLLLARVVRFKQYPRLHVFLLSELLHLCVCGGGGARPGSSDAVCHMPFWGEGGADTFWGIQLALTVAATYPPA